VQNWLDDKGGLPDETRNYVARITGRAAEDWREVKDGGDATTAGEGSSCLQVVALLRRPGADGVVLASPVAPWGVQLAGNFSKDTALASFTRARQSYAGLLGNVRPMVIGTRLRSRGTRTFYRVRVPAETRTAANTLCDKIRSVGGSCVVLPS
jgi:hypothetical protein